MVGASGVLQFIPRAGILDLGWGHPRPDLLPVEGWSAAYSETLRGPDAWQAMAYGHATGPAPLIDWLAEHLVQVDAGRSDRSRFFITAGASHALTLALAALTVPGDLVLVDAPTYHLAFHTIVDSGCRIVTAPVDDGGPDADAIAALVERERRSGHRVAMLYLVSTFGNPTGRSIPETRRIRLVELAHRLDITLVEDDTYRELGYDGPTPPSLWSLSGGHGVVRLGSFSKTVAPGLRLGWINAAEDVINRLGQLGYVDSGGGVNHTNACVMATFGSSGDYDRHVRSIRIAYAAQRDALVDTLTTRIPDMPTPRPAGGWFVWIPLPYGLSASELLPIAEQHGVSFATGTKFYVDGLRGDDHIRLSFSLLAQDRLVEAATRLADAMDRTASGERR